MCKDACHYICKYMYICMRKWQHIYKHTYIQKHPNFNSDIHKQNPPSNKKLTIGLFLKTFHSVWLICKAWNPGSQTLQCNVIYIYIYKLCCRYWPLFNNTAIFNSPSELERTINLFNIFIYINTYISKLSSQCPRTVGVDYSWHRIYEGNHIILWECSMYGYC